jgi:hypothetical protein
MNKVPMVLLTMILMVGCSTPDPLAKFSAMRFNIPGRNVHGQCAPFAHYTVRHLRMSRVDAHVLLYMWFDKPTDNWNIHAIAVWRVKKGEAAELWTADNTFNYDVPKMLCSEKAEVNFKEYPWDEIIRTKLDRRSIAIVSISP